MKKLFLLLVITNLFRSGNSIENLINKKNVPKSVAIIMDGNRRWGTRNGISVNKAHYLGAKNVERILKLSFKIGIKELTIFGFSTENWKRSKKEIDNIISIFENFLKENEKELLKSKIKVKILGRIDNFCEKTREEINKIEEETKDGIYTLNICFNYSGRTEIVDAVNKVIKDNIKNIDEENFKNYLYNKEMIDPDLIIRTGGNYRISNFLLWQLAYSELYISNKYWPEFDERDFINAILEFQHRERTFGGNHA